MSLVFSLWLLLLLQPNHSRLEITESCHRKKKYFTCTLPIIILTSVKETSNFWRHGLHQVFTPFLPKYLRVQRCDDVQPHLPPAKP